MLPQTQPFFFVRGRSTAHIFLPANSFWNFFREHTPINILYLNFIFILPPPNRVCDGFGKFFLPAFFRNNFFRGPRCFSPGRRRNFLPTNFCRIIFCEVVVSFSTLEPILLYISSNVYRIDPKKRTLRALKGYKVDFS